MIRLTINNCVAVLKNGVSFTFVRENPFFSNAGDSTYEVVLPLADCVENQKIFGTIYRAESSLTQLLGKRFPFTLLAPPLPLISGNAVVIDVDHQDVKLQLLAGTSQFNDDKMDAAGRDIYIDELELGGAYDKRFPEAYKSSNVRATLINCLFAYRDVNAMFGTLAQTECVNFPIYSKTDGALSNEKAIHAFHRYNQTYVEKHYNYPGDATSVDGEQYTLAAQPYFVVLLKRIFAAMGYEVVRNEIEGTWMENIFIANCKNEYEYRKILPHWTVSEFIKEVRQFFGVFIQVDDKKVSIIRRFSYLENPDYLSTLKNVVDEYSTSIDEDEDSADISSGNVAYDLDCDAMMSLSDEVWNNAKIMHFPYKGWTMLNWIKQHISDEAKAKSEYIFVDDEPNKVYAHLKSVKDGKYYLSQVDVCPPLIRDGQQNDVGNRDIDITMRIVPALMDKELIPLHSFVGRDGAWNPKIEKDKVTVPMLVSDVTREKLNTVFSVNDAINEEMSDGENNIKNDFDKITVALNYGDTWHCDYLDMQRGEDTFEVPMAYGIGYVKQNDGFYIPIICANNQDQFNLTKKEAPGIYPSVVAPNAVQIDTRCVHVFKFVDDVEISPLNVFLIRNRRYICQKIEYVVDDKGVKMEKKGYFYEITEAPQSV